VSRPAAPDASTAYGGEAGDYDQRTDAFRHWREQLVRALPMRPGDTVLDVGCGTGLCFPLLQDKIGPTGTVIGIDASPEMLHIARERVTQRGWRNVHLLASPVAQAPIAGLADAALFCAVHDVLQSPAALRTIVEHLRPGAAVAAAGGKRPGPWMWPLRPWVSQLHTPYISDFTGFDKPWQYLAALVPDLTVRELAFGAGYIALGHTPVAENREKLR
jgi:ubiquinone/menaquinone biosynthesis C-methylase UbiE